MTSTTEEVRFTKQETRVLEFIIKHRGATTKDIILGTGITCPSARITTLRQKGVQIVSIGKEHYAGSQPYEKYAVLAAKPRQETIDFSEQ